MKNRKKIIAFESLPDFSDNSRALYEYFKKNAKNGYEFVWLLTNKDSNPSGVSVRCIHPGDDNFDDEFSKIDIIFSTHNINIIHKKSYQTWICLWHGGGFKNVGKFLDNKSQSTIDWINLNSSRVDYFLSTSRFMSAIQSCEMGISYDCFLEFGQPRVDNIKSIDSRKYLSKLLRGIDTKIFNKIIINLPTFKNGIGRKDGKLNKGNSLNCVEYDEVYLNRYLSENNILLITKLHPLEEESIDIGNSSNIFVVTNKMLGDLDITLNSIIGAADLLVTDYSSVYKDFLLLKKPVLFIHSDFDDYNKDRGIVFGDEDLWFPGPRINNIEEFIVESSKLLSDKKYFARERARTNKVINGDYNFDSCKKILDFVENRVYRTHIPNEDLLGKISDLNIERDKLLKEVSNLSARNRGLLETSISSLQEEYSKCRADLLEQKINNKSIRKLNNELLSRINSIENSRVWKMSESIKKLKIKITK